MRWTDRSNGTESIDGMLDTFAPAPVPGPSTGVLLGPGAASLLAFTAQADSEKPRT